MSNILLYRQFFFHSLTFCPMDNRSTFFLPFIPQTHTAVVSCCNGRRSLPPFPLYAWAYHFMDLHYRHGLFLRSKGTANEQRVKYRFATPDKFDANFPQSQIAAFHKILTSVPCLLFLLSPLGIARKNQLWAKSEGFKKREIKKQNNDSNRTDYRHS